jgi:hypothetical protein
MALLFKHGALSTDQIGWVRQLVNGGKPHVVLVNACPEYVWLKANLPERPYSTTNDFGDPVTRRGVQYAQMTCPVGYLIFFATKEDHETFVKGRPELVIDPNPFQTLVEV